MMTEELNQKRLYKLMYRKERYQKRTIKCIKCGKTKHSSYKNICNNCYKITHHIPKAICNQCGGNKTAKRYNICGKCYLKNRSLNIPDQKILCLCGCGKYLNKFDKRGRTRRFIYKHHKGYKHTAETLAKYKLRCLPLPKQSNTLIELRVQNELTKKGILYIKSKPIKLGESLHRVDIFIPPNICIEIDGDYWHSRIINKTNGTLNIKRDYIINCQLENMGYKLLRFWEYDVNTNLQWVMNQISNVIDKKFEVKEYTQCACGCGKLRKQYSMTGIKRRYISGHHFRKNKTGRICLTCGSKTFIDNKGREHWFVKGDGFVCQNCYIKEKRLLFNRFA